MFSAIKKVLFLFLLLFFLSIGAEDVVTLSLKPKDFAAVALPKKSEKQIYLRSFFGGGVGKNTFSGGVSLSFVPWKSLEITVGGGGFLLGDNETTAMFFSKIGWSFEADLRKKDSGVILRMPLAFGWRYFSLNSRYDFINSNERIHTLNLSFGLELVAMFNKSFGLSFYANIAVDVIVAYRYHEEVEGIWEDVPSDRVFPYFDGGVINFVWRF